MSPDEFPRLRVAATCASGTRIETLAATAATECAEWLRQRADVLSAAGADRPLYVFLRDPPDSGLADVLRSLTSERRWSVHVVAPESALRAGSHFAWLADAGVRALYLTLCGGTAETHEARSGAPGSWRRTVAILAKAPRLLESLQVGAHVMLSTETAPDVAGILRLMSKVGHGELLLWDAGMSGADAPGLDAAVALCVLDIAVTEAQKLAVPIRPVGFERARSAVVPIPAAARVVSGVVVELLRDGIPLPSVQAGLLATDGGGAAIASVASTGRTVGALAFELAAGGFPLLDLPACLGGPPPERGVAHPDNVKLGACRRCPIERRCVGVPRALLEIAGLDDEIGPLPHWLPMSRHARVLVLCPVVSDRLYGATFFSLARSLAALGAHLDVVTPWDVHAGISPSFSHVQEPGRPDGRSTVEDWISTGPLDEYDLIITPEPKTTHPLVVHRRLGARTRLAVTDFHMLGGVDLWVRDLCGAARRAEEGGWWPSDRVILYSAFPGYARLYTRYGVPMQQVAWQPYVLDPASFAVGRPTAEGTAIISGGNHRRDLDTLLAAAARLGDRVHPVDLFAEGELPRVAPPLVRFRGTVPTAAFCPAVGQSRFMVVPLLDDPQNAAGITAMVTAIMYGRPIVATATAAARDYVEDGVNGLLVSPGDPQALAEAIERLDRDPALLASLAAGASRAARTLTTETWARALLDGTRTHDEDHWVWTKWRSPTNRWGARWRADRLRPTGPTD